MIFLSASKLNLLRDCPKCYWLLMKKKIRRPGLMPAITAKIDSVIKNYYNEYRMRDQLPPIFNGQIGGRLAVNMPLTLRFEVENGIVLLARPDDFIELEDYSIIPLDNKTASKAPASVHDAYQLQMSVYSFILKEMGFKTTNKGLLVYYHPEDCDLHNGMLMRCSVVEVNTAGSDQIRQLLGKAVEVLSTAIPERGETCAYCTWEEQVQSAYRERSDHASSSSR